MYFAGNCDRRQATTYCKTVTLDKPYNARGTFIRRARRSRRTRLTPPATPRAGRLISNKRSCQHLRINLIKIPGGRRTAPAVFMLLRSPLPLLSRAMRRATFRLHVTNGSFPPGAKKFSPSIDSPPAGHLRAGRTKKSGSLILREPFLF